MNINKPKSQFDEDQILNLINKAKDEVRNLEHVKSNEIDFTDNYINLKNLISQMLKNGTYIQFKDFKYILLVFALEVAKKPVHSFWKELFDELSFDQKQRKYFRNRIFEILWKILVDIGVENNQFRKRRLLVGTLRMKVESDPAFLTDATRFFIIYYKNYKGKNILKTLKKYDFYQKYISKGKDEQFIIITEKLTKTIDFIQNNALDYIENDYYLNEIVFKELGFLPRQYTRKRLSTIVRQVINRFTPNRFKIILRENRGKLVTLPNKKRLLCELLERKTLAYGLYFIDDEEFQVTPDIKISLEDLKKWKLNRIEELNNYLFYKKREFFKTSIGEVKEVFLDHEKFFLWFGVVPIGEEIFIDDKKYQKEGFSWTPQIKIKWPDKNDPIAVIIEIGKISCYYPQHARKKLKIKINDKNEVFQLDSKGVFFNRNIRFIIRGFPQNVNLKSFIGETEIKSANFKLDNHMLFSSNDRGLIKGNITSNVVKRSFGEERYYLFSTSQKNKMIIGNSIDLNKIGNFGEYKIYEVNWKGNEEFFLKIEDYKWIFEQKKYLEVFFEDMENTFESLKDISLKASTNLDNARLEEDGRIRILNKDHFPINEGFDLDRNNVQKTFIIEKNYLFTENSFQDLHPGEYILEIIIGELISELNFFILPKISIKWPDILKENQKSFCHIQASEKYLFNSKTSELLKDLEIPLYGKVLFRKNPKDKKLFGFPDDISVRVKFNLQYTNSDEIVDTNYLSIVSKKYYPPTKIPVLGYRYILKNNLQVLKGDLDYYDLDNVNLIIFTRPYEEVIILNSDDEIICSNNANELGMCSFEEVYELKTYCNSNKTTFKIESAGKNINLVVLWYPIVYSLKGSFKNDNVLSNNKIVAEVESEGSKGDKIILELKNIKITLERKTIICKGEKAKQKITFGVPKRNHSNRFYLTSFISTSQGKLLPSKSFTLYNKLNSEIEVRMNSESIKVSEKKFMEKIIEFANYVLSNKGVFELISGNNEMHKDFVELLALLNSEVLIIVPKTNQVVQYENIVKITRNKSSIHVLRNIENYKSLLKILDPFKFSVEQGIMVSTDQFLSVIPNYFPRPDLIIIVEAQDLNKKDKMTISSYSKDNTLVFIENL